MTGGSGTLIDRPGLVLSRPDGTDWVDVGHLSRPGAIEDEAERLRAAMTQGLRQVAALWLGSWLGAALLEPLLDELEQNGRGWSVLGGVSLRRHREGWFDGLALHRPTLLVPRGNDQPVPSGATAQPLPDLPAVRRRVAHEVVQVLAPLLGRLGRWGSYPAPRIWGSVLDGVAGAAMHRERAAGTDGARSWAELVLLASAVDEVLPAAGRRTPRPQIELVPGPRGPAPFVARGSCCLNFRLSPGDAEALCSSCPLQPRAQRRSRWTTWLAEQPWP